MERRYLVATLALVATFAIFSREFRAEYLAKLPARVLNYGPTSLVPNITSPISSSPKFVPLSIAAFRKSSRW